MAAPLCSLAASTGCRGRALLRPPSGSGCPLRVQRRALTAGAVGLSTRGGGFQQPQQLRRLRFLVGAAAGVAAAGVAASKRSCCGNPERGFSLASRFASVACAESSVEKPETHRHRSYEYLRLGNGLQVILASDPSCDKAAAALCVGVGRLHEPKGTPGLAHFCEHMLFLGTERFPDEAEYKRFLKGHGGKCNAATGDAYTCYAFDVAPDFLSGALDRFSQFFLAPLFAPSATEREINAVDSEHSMRITDDGRRSYAALLLDANVAHPLHWGSGNAKTLRDEPRARGSDAHREVLEFYRQHYSSEDMTLAVLGREPLPELRRLVAERFADVRATGRRALRGDAHGVDEPAVKPEDFPGLLLRVPSKDIRQVAFSWQLPQWQVPFFESKPGAYASFLLGHEGEGSLLSALKARGWGTSLHAGVDDFGCFSNFEVSATLTEAGLDHVEEVGALVFTYLRLIRATPVLPWVLDEMRQLREVRFRFADDQQPYNLVERLAKNLQNYPPQKVLAAPVKIPKPDAASSARLLRLLTAEGVRVELVGKRFAERCTSVDPWYGGQYCRERQLADGWHRAWSQAFGDATGSSEASLAAEAAAALGLRLPQPNPFVPEDLALLPPPQRLLGTSAPRQLDAPGVALAFHRQDDRFLQPKVLASFRIHSSAAAQDAASYLRCQVWCSCVVEALNEFAYDAQSAGLSYSLGAVPGGLELSVSGFSEKLPLLLDAVARKMLETSSVEPGTFAIVRDRYERGLRNRSLKQRPCDLAARKTRELRHSLGFTTEDQLEALLRLSAEDLRDENRRLLSECRVEALLTGNADAEAALALAAIADARLQPLRSPAGRFEPPWRAEAALPGGSTLWQLEGTSPEERNNALRLVLQLPKGLESSVRTALLVRILSPRFFEELRTKQQLGYIVQMSSEEHEGFLSVIFAVQTEYPPDYVRSRIDAFLDQYLDYAEQDLEEAEFARQRAGVAANLAEAPKNLGEEFGRYWGEITRQSYDFGRRERKRQAVEAFELKDFRAFVRDQVRTAPRLYVQVQSLLGDGKQPPEGEAWSAATPDRVWRGMQALEKFRAKATAANRWVSLRPEQNFAPEGPGAAARL